MLVKNDRHRHELRVIPPTRNVIYTEPCEETMKRLPDKSVDLIIADPPYYKIKGKFDWKWKTFTEYLEWMEELAKGFKRILADNGSLFVYGHAKRIAYIQVIYDKYFTLENNIVWETDDPFGTVYSMELRSFAPLTERILFYSKDYDAMGNPFSEELTRARAAVGLSINQVAEKGKFYGNINHGGSVTNWEKGYNVPSLEQWELMKTFLPIKKEYEELRREYEELRRPFSNILNLSDVWKFNRESVASKAIQHDTVKPLRLSKAMVTICSKEQDLVYVPFVGSGTECVAVNELNRNYIGSEIDPQYVAIAEARIKGSRQNYDMFYDNEAV